MVVPQIKSLTSPDLEPGNLPADPSDCCVLVDAHIGPKGEIGEEDFSFVVATPACLARLGLPRWGRGMLIVETFSWPVVEHALARLLAHAHRNTWHDVAQALNHELHWEFDNYQHGAG